MALFLFLVPTFFYGCINSTDAVLNGINAPFPKVTHLAMQMEKGERWGMIDVDGKVLFANIFNSRPSYAVNGVFRIKEFDAKSKSKFSSIIWLQKIQNR